MEKLNLLLLYQTGLLYYLLLTCLFEVYGYGGKNQDFV